MRLSATLLFASCLAAPALAGDEAGTIKTLKGEVVIERAGNRIVATPGAPVQAQDRIVTGKTGSVGITLRDHTLMTAGANSVLELNRFAFNPTQHTGALDATVKRGRLLVVSGKLAKTTPESVTFRTPTTVAGLRGTEFIIDTQGEAH